MGGEVSAASALPLESPALRPMRKSRFSGDFDAYRPWNLYRASRRISHAVNRDLCSWDRRQPSNESYRRVAFQQHAAVTWRTYRLLGTAHRRAFVIRGQRWCSE